MDFSTLGYNFETVVLGIFAFSFLLQLFFYLFFFTRLAFHKATPKASSQPPISVIICARNEEKNLMRNLPLFFDQHYPEFEVVVVNDASWDSTKDILTAMQLKYDNLHVVNLEESDRHEWYGKKLALTLGIKGAKYGHLLLADADCVPTSKDWINNMTAGLDAQTPIVLGYSPYEKKKGLLNKLIRFDTFYIGLQYLSFALAKLPYMGVGRNLAYRKELFFSVSGFKTHYHIASGDDDLFINQVARSKNTCIEVQQNSHTISQPKTSWLGWWRQKRRHFTTAEHYRFVHKLLLFLLPLSVLLFFISFIVLLILKNWMYVALGAFAFRFLMQIIIFNRAMRFLGDKDLIFFSPVFEVLFLFLNPIIYIAKLVAKPSRWS